MVVTFAGLFESTGFLKQMREIMRILRDTFGMPMDIEFAYDGNDLYILQCRPQSKLDEEDAGGRPVLDARRKRSFSRPPST